MDSTPVSWRNFILSLEGSLKEVHQRTSQLETLVKSLRTELNDERKKRTSLEDQIVALKNELSQLSDQVRTKRSKSNNVLILNPKKGLRASRSNSSIPLPKIEQVSELDSYDSVTFSNWLDSNSLSHFKSLFDSSKSDEKNEWTKMFIRVRHKNQIKLVKCPLRTLISFFIDIPDDDPLRKLWDTSSFVRDLILSHQEFISTDKLFKCFSVMCQKSSSPTLIYRIRDFTKQFINYRKNDFRLDPTLSLIIKEIAQRLSIINAEVGSDILNNIERVMKEEHSTDYFVSVGLANQAGTINSSRRIKLIGSEDGKIYEDRLITAFKNFFSGHDILALEDHAEEIAYTISSMEQVHYFHVLTHEFLNKAWEEKSKEQAPNLKKYIEFINRIIGWMTREILVQPTPKTQDRVITLFIEVGSFFYQYHNVNSLYGIISCLQAPAIVKMKSSWAQVPKKAQEDLSFLTNFMAPENRYRKYEEAISQINPSAAVIPSLTITLHDLLLTEVENPRKEKR